MNDSRTELERVVRRWRELPADHALECLPRMQALTQELADLVRAAHGLGPVTVPDLGPATALDQLMVMVHDVRREGLDRSGTDGAVAAADGGVGGAGAVAIDLAARLADLRRSL